VDGKNLAAGFPQGDVFTGADSEKKKDFGGDVMVFKEG